ncbi:K(+)/H(+) antiporter 1 [Cyberlindnera fabianii]|uniref:K(+)/H(+) antiporter 1 n=1 Tax=Cyberlindnera fabianii TaxID=36022 RepID=A0A1V2LBG9_CYBFA|nr:K(+)/H(+) antiporter 1 [Cyberlindnera fabianii]
MAVSEVGGIIAGRDPLEYVASSPITLFLFQAIFIIGLCQLIHIPLSLMRQPRVIAEVITGILLGPTALGHIPGFTDKCFPASSIPSLTLVANLGVILFLFLVGLEVDIPFIKKNIKTALSVCLINMSLPFGLGAAISVGLYNHYAEPHLKFSTYLVFISVAMCITAFPVLARILTELRLLKERVGTLVLAAGIVNDVIGWMLLALSVTLANSGSGINTLYILLVTVGWGLFVIYPIRWLLVKVILRKDLASGNLSRFSILIIMILVFISSFFTDIIGVHPIFGAFLIGIVVPREHGFVISLTQKIEDMVHIIMIPIYFALAGFNADLSALTDGIDWAYTIALIIVAVVSKVGGGAIAAKWNGLFWRESFTVGILMSCKGIVEIVVLNIGLNAGIITQKVFSMFVLMALVSTFLTTPLTMWVYPRSYREKVQRYARGELDWDGKNFIEPPVKEDNSSGSTALDEIFKINRVLYNVEESSDILSLLKFTELLYGPPPVLAKEPLCNVILLRELTERTADLIGATQTAAEPSDEMIYDDDVRLGLLRKMFEYTHIPFKGEISYYVEQDRLATYWDHAVNRHDFVVYSLPSARVDARLALSLRQRIDSRSEGSACFGMLIADSVKQTRFLKLAVKFSAISEWTNKAIVHLACMAAQNNTARVGSVLVFPNPEIPQKQFDALVEAMSSKCKIECVLTETLSDVGDGLLIAPLVPETVVEFVGSTSAAGVDTLLVTK